MSRIKDFAAYHWKYPNDSFVPFGYGVAVTFGLYVQIWVGIVLLLLFYAISVAHGGKTNGGI